MVFSDASRTVDHGQFSYLTGLLIGDLNLDTVFHTLSWALRKSKRPVKSIGAAEILEASEAIDEGKTLARTLSCLLDIELQLQIALDTKDLFTSLSKQKNSIHRSIRADVNFIHYEFETLNLNLITWIPGSVNLADNGTKPDSPLIESLQILLATGLLPFEFSNQATKSSQKLLG